MGLPPRAAVSDREGVVLCADRPSAGRHAMAPRLDSLVLRRHKGCRGDAHQRTARARAMAQDLSMVGLDRAKSAYTSVVAWTTPARWCARRTACVPCLGVSGSVEPPHTALARLERPPDVAARILSSWTKEFIHFMILVLMGTPKGKPLLAATFSNKPR